MEPTGRSLVSVVAPVFNEEDTVVEFYERSSAALARIDPAVDFEIILVNDGSSDGSTALLKLLCERDQRVRVVNLSRNFGHQAAITSGIDHARGDAVVVIDSDLQDPPEVIGDMVTQWRNGYHVVYGQRSHRAGERRSRLLVTRWFYRWLSRISDTPLPIDTGDFRLMDRRVVQLLQEQLREDNRYIRGLVSWVGFRQCAVQFQRDARYAGTAKYTVAKLITLALDGMTSFSVKPLRLSFQLGVVIVLLCLVYVIWIVSVVIFWPHMTPRGFASIMVAVLFLGGVQLLSIGLLGEYVGRIYRETKQRPLYVVEDRINFTDRIPHAPRRHGARTNLVGAPPTNDDQRRDDP